MIRSILVAPLVVLAACSGPQKREAFWKSELARNIPAGATKQTVETFFLSHGIRAEYNGTTRNYVAVERDIGYYLGGSWSIMLTCHLTASGVVDHCDAEPFGTGL